MYPSVPKLALLLIACLVPVVAGCTLRPYSYAQLAQERQAYDLATERDPYEIAQAAARTDIADRRIAVELLRELANRYRVAGREKVLASVDAALAHEGSTPPVVSASLQALPRQTAARASGTRKADGDTYAALRQSFDPRTSFGALVHRCIETIDANADKPTYNPKLFDWLCRASILPDAAEGFESGTVADNDRWSRHAAATERLMRLSESCTVSTALACGDAKKLIAQLINQQPVVPVPQHLNKISVERAVVPTPSAAAETPPPTTQTN
jgi:hypothetical protein